MKIKKSSALAKVLSCALIGAMLCSVGVFAAETYDSPEAAHGETGGAMYQYHATLYAGDGAKTRAATWMQVADGKSVPAGYMKAKAFLYDTAGNLCKSTTTQTNTAEAKFFFVATPTLKGTGEYVSQGQISSYLLGIYNTMQVSRIGNSKTDVITVLKTSLDKNGCYPVNAQGETYGSGLLSGVVGYQPNLIAAIGTNNVKGYVRTDELDPYTATPAEAVALAKSAKSVVLPLYDLNGKVIGTFVQDAGVTSNSKEFANVTFDAARAKVAAGAYTTPAQTITLPKTDAELTALAEKALTITPYSRNAKGQTYGSDTLSGAVGYIPDLIAVTTTDNKDGYAKKGDLYLPMSSGNQGDRSVPVYDLDGKVIGEFKIGGGTSSNDPEFKGLTIDEAREKVAAG